MSSCKNPGFLDIIFFWIFNVRASLRHSGHPLCAFYLKWTIKNWTKRQKADIFIRLWSTTSILFLGDRVYADEQSEFRCNTQQPGCVQVNRRNLQGKEIMSVLVCFIIIMKKKKIKIYDWQWRFSRHKRIIVFYTLTHTHSTRIALFTPINLSFRIDFNIKMDCKETHIGFALLSTHFTMDKSDCRFHLNSIFLCSTNSIIIIVFP